MLLNFSVTGYASIGDCQELTTCAFKGQRIKGTKYEENYIDTDIRPVKSILIFGNNAVGKSNVLLALKGLLYVLKEDRFFSNQRSFNRSVSDISMTIEVQSENEDIYKYSISFSRDGILNEECLEKNGREIYHFVDTTLWSPHLDERLSSLYSIETTSTILRRIKDFIPDVYKAFLYEISKIKICTEEFINRDAKVVPVDLLKEEKEIIGEHKELALRILKQLDFTIVEMDFEEVAYEDEEVRYRPFLVRRTKDSKERFSVAYDSKGIKRIMGLLSLILGITKGHTVCIDELDSSISTKSLFLLFNDIINSSSNKNGQLIVTTHNLELLDLDMFAPEQIYIVTKDERLFTQVNSLADFDLRNNRKRLSVSFLQGEFEV